ncbi:MAG: hypothetical protein IPI49_19435 [Myxococcales bacterium]|nr:hypothetical protein [Myxococcales bacterium]
MRILWILCCAILFWTAAAADASRMQCTVTQDVETLQILKTECLAVGDTISVRYVYVYLSMGASHPWMSGPISFGGAGADVGGGRPARARAASRLRSTTLQNKLRAAVRKVTTVTPNASRIRRACEEAAKGVEKAMIIRDHDTSEEVVGFTDYDALSIKVFGHPLIYVDGDYTDLVDAQWENAQGAAGSEPGGTLASTLLHEGMHACIELAGIPNQGTSAMHALHHRLMEEVGVPTCANKVGTTCPATEAGAHAPLRDIPSDALRGRSLESLARRRIQFAIDDGIVIEEPAGGRALVVGGHAFALDATPSREQRAAIGREKPVRAWRAAISEMREMRDGVVVQVPGGPLVTIVGGGIFLVPSVEALRAGGWDPSRVHRLWRGALDGLPTSPRDGTLVWEERRAEHAVRDLWRCQAQRPHRHKDAQGVRPGWIPVAPAVAECDRCLPAHPGRWHHLPHRPGRTLRGARSAAAPRGKRRGAARAGARSQRCTSDLAGGAGTDPQSAS